MTILIESTLHSCRRQHEQLYDLGILVLSCLDLAVKVYSPYSGDFKRALHDEVKDNLQQEQQPKLASLSSSSSTSSSSYIIPTLPEIITYMQQNMTNDQIVNTCKTKYNSTQYNTISSFCLNQYSIQDFEKVQFSVMNHALNYYLHPPTSSLVLNHYMDYIMIVMKKEKKKMKEAMNMSHDAHDDDHYSWIITNPTTTSIDDNNNNDPNDDDTDVNRNTTANNNTNTNKNINYEAAIEDAMWTIHDNASLQVELAIFDLHLVSTKPSILAFCALQNAVIQYFYTALQNQQQQQQQQQHNPQHDSEFFSTLKSKFHWSYSIIMKLIVHNMSIIDSNHHTYNGNYDLNNDKNNTSYNNNSKIKSQKLKDEIRIGMQCLYHQWKRNNPGMVTFDESIITSILDELANTSDDNCNDSDCDTGLEEEVMTASTLSKKCTSKSNISVYITDDNDDDDDDEEEHNDGKKKSMHLLSHVKKAFMRTSSSSFRKYISTGKNSVQDDNNDNATEPIAKISSIHANRQATELLLSTEARDCTISTTRTVPSSTTTALLGNQEYKKSTKEKKQRNGVVSKGKDTKCETKKKRKLSSESLVSLC